MNALPDVRVQYVRVTNNTQQMWTDTFDGVPVFVLPGKSQNIQLDMAAHFFGWHPDVKPEEMMRHVVRRRGLREEKYCVRGDLAYDQQLAAEMFKDLTIEPVTFKLVEERPGAKPAAREPVPALTDEDIDERLHEPTSVKEDDDGLRHPLDEVNPKDPTKATPYRGAARGRQPGRKREE